eukprot:TRINITY_DN2263_c0_g1_i1.p1 TRINITY_DN2263_c0_g1~~TRINITY_DN2263_c0_g1_i1.p1  ORF type:complete len:162 (+),score=33.90 TRINITY_DN2263_c0_g1_i1:2-487(+)
MSENKGFTQKIFNFFRKEFDSNEEGFYELTEKRMRAGAATKKIRSLYQMPKFDNEFRGFLLRPEFLLRRGYFIDSFQAANMERQGLLARTTFYRHLKTSNGLIIPWTVNIGKEHESSFGRRKDYLNDSIEDLLSTEDEIAFNYSNLPIQITGVIEGEIVIK